MKPQTLAEPILAGRKKELSELQLYLQSMSDGNGSTVFISGEAGSGKTRLAKEFMDCARSENITVLAGWCLSNAPVPFFPFIEAFDSYADNIEANYGGAQQLSLKTGLRGAYENSEAQQYGVNPQAWKDQTFGAVLRELLFMSASNPLILFIDDLHWADSASLALIHYLARSIKTERILILSTFRSEEISGPTDQHPLKELLHLMGREDLYGEIKLSKLHHVDVERIIEHMLGGKAHPHLIAKLSSESQGLPLFVVEAVRMLFDEQGIMQENGQWRLTVDSLNIPAKVKDVVLRRVESLPADQRKILSVASVIGEEFDPKLLSKVTSIDYVDVLESLNIISQSTLLVRCQGDDYWFSHGKFREMLYDQIPSLLKKEYHLRVAERIEELSQTENLPVSELAFHYNQAGNKEKSLRFAITAGNIALSRFSNNEALRYFNHVLDLIGDDPKYARETAAVMEGLGEAYFASSMFEAAIETFEELADSTAGLQKLRAYRRAMDSAFFKGEFARLLTLTKKAEEYSVCDRLEGARVLMNRARAVTFLGNIKAGTADFEAALKIFEEENSIPDIARVLLGLGGASLRQWALEKGLANSLRAILYFKELGDMRGLADAYNRAGQSFGYRMLNAEALRVHKEAIQIGERIGHYTRVAEAFASMSWIYEAMQEYPAALSASLKALEYAKKTGSTWTYAIVYANLVIEYSKTGDVLHAEQYYEALTKMPKEILANGFVRLAACQTVMAIAKGRWNQASACLQECLALLENGLNPSAEVMVRDNYARLLEKQGRLEEAKHQWRDAEKLKRKVNSIFEQSNVVAFFLVPKQVELVKAFNVRLDIVNVSEKLTEILRIEGVIPKGLRILEAPDFCTIASDCICIHPTAIGSFQINSIKIRMQAQNIGYFSFYPQVIYLDNLGTEKRYDLRPVIICVKASASSEVNESLTADEVYTPIEFRNEATRAIFDYLVRSFVEDSIRRKVPTELAGWRTLMDIVKNTQISKHSLYEFSRINGKPISELERIGLVVSKYFLGERGRGGRIIKIQVAYKNQAVSSYIANLTKN